MNFNVGKTNLNINFFYKLLLYKCIKKKLQSHIACDGNSLSTYNLNKKTLYKNPLFYFLMWKIRRKITEVLPNKKLIPHSMWINVSKNGGKIVPHNHYTLGEDSKISGAYYLNKPENSGNIIFHTTGKVMVEVKTNDLIFFDSKIFHETEENKSNEERIVCGFNFLML